MADLTVEEVAKELALHYETVRRFVQCGRIPGYKAGVRQWRVTREALDAYKARRSSIIYTKATEGRQNTSENSF